MGESTGVRRRREASQEDLKRLLARLDTNLARAWESYETLRQKLIIFFEHRYPFYAEELAEEALDRIAKKSESYEIENVAEFAFGVARNLQKEIFRRTSTRVQIEDAAIESQDLTRKENPEDTIINKIDFQRRLQCFLKCMGHLEAQDRQALFQYYPQDEDELNEHRQRLAEDLHTNLGALRTRMTRLRGRLEKCFEICCSRSKGSPTGKRISKIEF